MTNIKTDSIYQKVEAYKNNIKDESTLSDRTKLLQQMLKDGAITQEEYKILQQNTGVFAANGQTLQKQSSNGIAIETDCDAEYHTAMKFKQLLSNENLLNDDAFLLELDNVKNMDLILILENFRYNNDGTGLLDAITENPKLKDSTKNKYKTVFTQILEKEYSFDNAYSDKNNQTKFETDGFSYSSDSYNIKQKNSDILEIENLTTKEKRTIDFRTLVPEGINGINDIIALKSAIQKLPGEILFQIPDEISFIMNTSVSEMVADIDNTYVDYDGCVARTGENNDMELVESSPNPDTLIHETAHTVFLDKNGNDALLSNKKFMEAYNKAIERLQKDGLSFENDGEAYYWSTNPHELGAEVITAVFSNNYIALESIKKYAPEAIPLVLEQFDICKNGDNKHKHITIDEFLNANE